MQGEGGGEDREGGWAFPGPRGTIFQNRRRDRHPRLAQGRDLNPRRDKDLIHAFRIPSVSSACRRASLDRCRYAVAVFFTSSMCVGYLSRGWACGPQAVVVLGPAWPAVAHGQLHLAQLAEVIQVPPRRSAPAAGPVRHG